MFADRARISIRSGKGGDGHVSFRRELYVAAGGPDGGDGGDGGDLIFEVDPGINTLNDYRYKKKYSAGNGQEGSKRRMHGKDGEDLVLKVPEGTVIREASTGKVIVDMSGKNKRVVLLKGGRGGKGNMHYATPSMQVPKYAQPGKPAREMDIILELKLIADVGLIGFPNVGKSTLLSRISNAKPKIADYHFTTLTPMLGVVDLPDGKGFVAADIPGLIEGASDGLGLGHEFLQHVQRTRLFVHVVDAASTEGRDPDEDIRIINSELSKYDIHLAEKPQVIAANKTDALSEADEENVLKKLNDRYGAEGIPVIGISAVSGKGIKELLFKIREILDTLPDEPFIYEPEITADEINEEEDTQTSVYYDQEEEEYVIEGPKIEKMLGYTNLDSEKGFDYFQKYLRKNGLIDRLKDLGISEGDTVRIYGFSFEYYD